jgi:hypothetical protein
MRLLQLMGWRPGRGIGTATDASKAAEKGSKWGTVSGVSLDNTPLYVLLPKVRCNTSPHLPTPPTPFLCMCLCPR